MHLSGNRIFPVVVVALASKPLEAGLQWLGKNFSVTRNPPGRPAVAPLLPLRARASWTIHCKEVYRES